MVSNTAWDLLALFTLAPAQFLESAGELFMCRQRLAQPDKVRIMAMLTSDGAFAVQDRGHHRHALLGKHVAARTCDAAPALRSQFVTLKRRASSSLFEGQLEHKVVRKAFRFRLTA